MTGSDSPTPNTFLSDKLALVTHHHLLTRVPVKLDLDDWNFRQWEFFFEELCASYEVDKYLRSPINETSALAPLTPKETKVDKIDNKRSHTNTLKAELRSIKLGDQSMESYFQKIDSTVNILTSLDARVNEEDVVHYALEVAFTPSSHRFNSRLSIHNDKQRTPISTPTLTLVEKLYAVHNINSFIPEKLDHAESNYFTWSYFFKGHCSNFGVLNHIKEPVTEATTLTPPTDEWITADSIVKSWIFLTLSLTLRKRLIKANPKTPKAAWDAIETIFQDNKRTRTISLKDK
ncbi:hypothetical protein Tco_0090194 [Tanacetum coccineum]